jgi:hypothetical protein
LNPMFYMLVGLSALIDAPMVDRSSSDAGPTFVSRLIVRCQRAAQPWSVTTAESKEFAMASQPPLANIITLGVHDLTRERGFYAIEGRRASSRCMAC